MLISGDFIALSKGTDFVSTLDKEGHGPDLPEVIWFNIRNIVALSCYKNSYRLCLDEEHNITIEASAANELIALMRKERDDKVRAFFNDPRNKDAIKACFKEYAEEKEGK